VRQWLSHLRRVRRNRRYGPAPPSPVRREKPTKRADHGFYLNAVRPLRDVRIVTSCSRDPRTNGGGTRPISGLPVLRELVEMASKELGKPLPITRDLKRDCLMFRAGRKPTEWVGYTTSQARKSPFGFESCL
jgi:hypothetical protein